jgi:hypothetical protein
MAIMRIHAILAFSALSCLLFLGSIVSLGVSLAGLKKDGAALDWHLCDLVQARRAELWRPAFRALPTTCPTPPGIVGDVVGFLLNVVTGTAVLFALAILAGCVALLVLGVEDAGRG